MYMPGVNNYRGSDVYILATYSIVIRRAVKSLPMSELVIQHLNHKASREGFTRGSSDPSIGADQDDDREEEDDDTPVSNLIPADSSEPPFTGVESLQQGNGGALQQKNRSVQGTTSRVPSSPEPNCRHPLPPAIQQPSNTTQTPVSTPMRSKQLANDIDMASGKRFSLKLDKHRTLIRSGQLSSRS